MATSGASIVGGVLTTVIVSVLVLVAGLIIGGLRPPWVLQPATVAPEGRVVSPSSLRRPLAAAVPVDDDDTTILMDSLRALGLARRRVGQPVVGRSAYVRLWERLRALTVLTALIMTIGVVLAATIGLLFLAIGFLLEQAIS